MQKDLDAQLCEKYPKLFVERNLPMAQTAMCWGLSCGDGWFNIIDKLCANIQSHIDWKNKNEEVVPQVVVKQVKEKFGTLRFYISGGDDYVHGLVAMAESMSAVTCESCGASAKLRGASERGITGWLHTYCDHCEEEREKQRATQV